MGTIVNSYPNFAPGTLLKSSDLNSLFTYLDSQDHTSNLYLDGIGIAYGLNVSFNTDKLTISKGFGVTSAGQLVILEENKVFGVAVQVTKEFQNKFTETMELVLVSEAKNTLTYAQLEGKCVFAYIDSNDSTKTSATCGVRSDRASKYNEYILKFYIGKPTADPDTNGKLPFSIPQIRRLGNLSKGGSEINLNAFTDKTTLIAGFKGIFTEGVTHVFQSYSQLIKNYPDVVCLTKTQPTEAALLKYFKDELKDAYDLRYQNAYDYLKDVEAAFEELAQCAWFKINYQMPNQANSINLLPLGKVSDDCSTCRQEWQSVQAYNATLQEAIFYAERLRLMLLGDSLDFEKLIIDNQKDDIINININLTPSKSPLFPLSQRAMPIYFKTTTLLAQWNCPWTQTLLTDEIPTVEDNPNKMLYDTEGFDFYHINGHLGRPLKEVLNAIEDKKRQYNVAFDIVPIYFRDIQAPTGINFLDKGIHLGCSLRELEREFGQQKLNTLCILRQYLRGSFTYNESNPELQPLKDLIDDFQSRCLNNFDYKLFMQRHKDIFIDTPSPKVEVRKLTILPCLFDYFKVLQQLYITHVKARHFQYFALCHPGLEHANGVLRGGTLVLVYDTKPENLDKAQSSVFKPTVVADFMLPGCVQWHLPTAAFTMAIDIRSSNSIGNVAANISNTVSLKLTNYAIGADSVDWQITADVDDSKELSDKLFGSREIDECGNANQILNTDIFKNAKQITFKATQRAFCGKNSSVYSEELIYTRSVEAPQPTGTSNEKILRQRHQSYKSSIESLENDKTVKENRATNLARLFVVLPKAQPKLTEDFEEFLKKVMSAINLKSKQTEQSEQQDAYLQLLETTTYFFFDKLIAESKTLDENTLNAIKNTADFLIKKEQDATAFVTKWQSKDIELEDNKSLISNIEELFKKA